VAEVFKPENAAAVAGIVQDAFEAGRSLEIVGAASRRALGHPVQADAILDLSALTGVTLYEPEELVLTLRPATPMAQVAALLAEGRQHLAFEPPDFGPLWGQAPGGGTIGGAMAVGFGGPRRPSAGGPRDHLLGFSAVNGFGEPFAAGGRVVKNVTGFDLSKLMAGAFGTLGVITEMTLKVLPAPEAARTLVLPDLSDAAGLAALRAALASPVAISAAAHLPADISGRIPGAALPTGRAATLIRLEGVAPALAASEQALTAVLGLAARAFGQVEDEASRPLWRAIGGAWPFATSAAPVWRVCAPPAGVAGLGAALRLAGATALYYDWGGGALWVEGPRTPDAGAADIRAALAALAGEGHATLVRAPTGLDAAVPRFQPASPGVERLTARIRAQFDPKGLFNPGKMRDAR
jgi:glycolate oxidase FAD binding subunit